MFSLFYQQRRHTYIAPVPIRRYTRVSDAHAEAADAAELIFRGQVEGVRLALVTSKARRVLLQI